MSRAIGTATISFGLVAVPVKIYSATETQNSISFNLLHKNCGSRLKQFYKCSKDDVGVERDQMSKGYEYAKDQYVVFAPEEIKALEDDNTHTIDITETIPFDQLDPIYFDKPYFLSPDKGGTKGYALLHEALKRSGQCALAKYVSRGREHLTAVRPIKDGLVLQYLLYKEEVRNIKDIPLNPIEPKEAEVELALQLISSMAVQTFDPSKYRDEFKDRLMGLINAKIEGKDIVNNPVGEKVSVPDLMEALKRSLNKK